MRRFLASFFILLVTASSHADISSRLNISTVDNTTCNTYPYKLIFPNANCTDNSNGTVSISITGGGGGPSGQINNANQNSVTRYSVSGSSNVLSGSSIATDNGSTFTVTGVVVVSTITSSS